MKTTVIVPTYNERENLIDLVEQILALDIGVHVIVVDDNSPDGTGKIAEELATRNERVCVIHRSGKLGLGTAYIAGFKQALANDSNRVVTMDADFSHNPRYIPDLVALADRHDLTIGSRYVDGGGGVSGLGSAPMFLELGSQPLCSHTFGSKSSRLHRWVSLLSV